MPDDGGIAFEGDSGVAPLSIVCANRVRCVTLTVHRTSGQRTDVSGGTYKWLADA